MKIRHAVLVCVIGIVLLLTSVSSVQAAPSSQMNEILEISGDPLRILVDSDATIQVFHSNYPDTGSVYSDTIENGASGPFVAVGEDVFGQTVPAWMGNQDPIPMTEVENTGPLGTGTEDDPYQIITVLEISGEDYSVQIEQTVSYVDGQDHFQLDWTFTNTSGEEVDFKFYHAADIYFAGSDEGFGYAADDVVGGYNATKDWYMAFEAITPADHYKEAYYGEIWQYVGDGLDLDDTILENYDDNGVALQWNIHLGARESETVSDLWRFGDMPPVVGDVDVWVKDSPEDDGSVPSTDNNAAWWTSPDIVVRNEWDDEKGHQNPIEGQENYIYVNVRNSGEEDAENVTVIVYYADANQLSPSWPDNFDEVASTIINVPANGEIWTDAIAWEPPASGHLCLYVRLISDQDPIQHEGNVPGDNNIAQRNVHVVTMQSTGGESADTAVEPILSNPSTDPDAQIDLVLQYPEIPETLRVFVVMPNDLFEEWEALGGWVEGGEVDGGEIEVSGWDETIIYDLPIDPGEEAQITIRFEGSVDDPFTVSAIERLDGEDIGGNVYYYSGLEEEDQGEVDDGKETFVEKTITWLSDHCCLSIGILLGVVLLIVLIIIVL